MSHVVPHVPRLESGHRSAPEVLAALAPTLAVAAIWVSTLVFSIFAPVLMAARSRRADDDPARWLGFELSVAVVWAVVALAGIFAPDLVTGSDPTRVPLAALVTPVAGMVATGFVALHATTQQPPGPR